MADDCGMLHAIAHVGTTAVFVDIDPSPISPHRG